MKTRSPDLFRKRIDQKNFLLYQQITELLADRKSVKYFFLLRIPRYFGKWWRKEEVERLEAVVHKCSVKKGVLRKFVKFTGKHLCQKDSSVNVTRSAGICGFGHIC